MECRKIELLITLRLDGAITKEDDAFLEKHLENCSSCSRELELRKRFSSVLREIGGVEMEAPPEFCRAVMSRLQAERRSSLTWLPVAWRKSIAAAAAILLLAGGSAVVTAGLKLPGGGKTVATTPVQTTGAAGENLTATPDDESKGTGVMTAGNDGVTGSAASNDKDSAAVTSEIAANQITPAGISAPTQTVMLRSGIKVTGTILKVTVGNLGDARAKAVALAAGAGAATQVFPEQHGDKKIMVIRIAVTSDKAPGLIAELTEIGALFDRSDESRDITSLYNETKVQYLDLQSRINSSQNAEELHQMEIQAESYKQQLDAWDTEAGKRIITLWLESS